MEKLKQLKTKEEMEAYLKALLKFLLDSAEAYDMGFEGEAQRLAVVMRAMLDDPEGRGNLLKRLGYDLHFYDNSPEYNPSFGLPYSGLALYAPKKGKDEYAPRLGRNPGVPFNKVSFDEWWNKPVIIDEPKNIKITRKDIIITVSNTYSEAATRPKLNQEFNEIILGHPVGWVDEKASVKKEPLLGMEFASTRHMAFELVMGLEEQIPKYFEGFQQQ